MNTKPQLVRLILPRLFGYHATDTPTRRPTGNLQGIAANQIQANSGGH
jgi:hypothetical protein